MEYQVASEEVIGYSETDVYMDEIVGSSYSNHLTMGSCWKGCEWLWKTE